MFEQYKSALEQEYNAKYNLEFMEGAEYGSEEGFEGDPGFLEGESFEDENEMFWFMINY